MLKEHVKTSQSKPRPIHRIEWAREKGKELKLSPKARHVLLVLATYADTEYGSAWPLVETIQDDTGLGRSAVYYALKELAKVGVIEDSKKRKDASSIRVLSGWRTGWKVHNMDVRKSTNETYDVQNMDIEPGRGGVASLPLEPDIHPRESGTGETEQQAAELWTQGLTKLQDQVSAPIFNTWLKDTKGVRLSDGRLLVSAPTSFVAEWLDKRMISLMEDSIGANVQLIVAEGADTYAEQPDHHVDG